MPLSDEITLTLPIDTRLTVEGKAQRKRDAATIGGSAAGGAVLGRVLGKDSKGAALGAVLGAAIGTAVATRNPGDPVVIAAGRRVELNLESAVDVAVAVPDGAGTATAAIDRRDPLSPQVAIESEARQKARRIATINKIRVVANLPPIESLDRVGVRTETVRKLRQNNKPAIKPSQRVLKTPPPEILRRNCAREYFARLNRSRLDSEWGDARPRTGALF